MTASTVLEGAEQAGLLPGNACDVDRPRRFAWWARRRALANWTDAADELVAWYLAERDRVPAPPFTLSPGVIVTDRDRFVEAIDRDVSAGPAGARAAALLVDLAALRRIIDS